MADLLHLFKGDVEQWGKERRGMEQEGRVKYKFGTTQANHTLKDCNLDFPRIARKVGREKGQNNINFLAARNSHNNNTLCPGHPSNRT